MKRFSIGVVVVDSHWAILNDYCASATIMTCMKSNPTLFANYMCTFCCLVSVNLKHWDIGTTVCSQIDYRFLFFCLINHAKRWSPFELYYVYIFDERAWRTHMHRSITTAVRTGRRPREVGGGRSSFFPPKSYHWGKSRLWCRVGVDCADDTISVSDWVMFGLRNLQFTTAVLQL